MADERVVAELDLSEGMRTRLSTRLHAWVGDMHESEVVPEPVGPDPFAQLLGALGSCMAMTVHLYVARKGWTLERVRLTLRDDRAHESSVLERVEVTLELEGDLDEKQRARVLEIAERCPVHRTLSGSVGIRTTLA